MTMARVSAAGINAINRRDVLRLGLAAGVLGATGGLLGAGRVVRAEEGKTLDAACGPIEPTAGKWDLWLFNSVRGLRAAAPPGAAMTQKELRKLEGLAAQRQALLDRIRFWDAGAVYRWVGIGLDMMGKFGFGINPLNGAPLAGLTLNRNIALVMTSIYDATIATWDSKYAYNRLRPSQIDPRLSTAVAVPASPSYPSEHAAIAGAASTILGHLYPSQTGALAAMVDEDVLTRQVAGVEFPSDVAAGLELGQHVGAAAIQRAMADGAEVPWSGTLPTSDPTGRGDPVWTPPLNPATGLPTAPIYPNAGSWKTWVMTSGGQFRAPLFPSLTGGLSDLSGVVNFNRDTNGPNFARNAEAFLAQTNAGQFLGEFQALSQRIEEERLSDNPPRTARVYALHAVAGHDAMVACFESKYHYMRLRPFQASPGLKTLFPTPNHPSYPAAHGAGSGAAGAISAFLFPRDADALVSAQQMLAQSRLWAGIHYQTDIDAGLAQGRAVAQLVMDKRGKIDGVSSAAASAAVPECET
jgi:membrane-associated phospholipid phosphatase